MLRSGRIYKRRPFILLSSCKHLDGIEPVRSIDPVRFVFAKKNLKNIRARLQYHRIIRTGRLSDSKLSAVRDDKMANQIRAVIFDPEFERLTSIGIKVCRIL